MREANIDSPGCDALHYLWTPDLDPLFSCKARAGVISAWYGHIPFAHWIVSVAKPHCLVELGTHNGVSYSAFCEAVLHNRFDTRCYAVDTWRGDDQAGHYSEEVYRNFCRFHDERYSVFSELLRCTFDEALAYTPDASVDLLHIDGLHTYEAVRHDFENWRPKLSDRAIVLLHDTNVRERDFGVWRLWEELRAEFPSFEFLHGHGLGVIAVGDFASPQVIELCSLSDPSRISAIRQRFCLLGERWILLYQREHLQKEEIPSCNERIQLLEEGIRSRDVRISSLEVESNLLSAEGEKRKVAERELLQQFNSLKEQLHFQSFQSAERVRQLEEQLRFQSDQFEAKICQSEEQLRSQGSESANKIRLLEEQVAKLNVALGEARRLCHGMKGSLSWKLTWPFRVLRNSCAATLNKVKVRQLLPLNGARAPETVVDTHAAYLAHLIGESGFFDADFYDGSRRARAQGVAPELHYILVGEKRGLKPSPAFDPVYYGERYPDVAASGGNRLAHYLETGKEEGRRPLPIADTLTLPLTGFKPEKPAVIVLVHEASRTGAPILGWNILHALGRKVNTIAVLLKGGRLERAFAEVAAAVVGPVGEEIFDPIEGAKLARRLSETYRPAYVIANSVATCALVPGFEGEAVPVIALVHEFSGPMATGTLRQLYERASEIVFSADIVRRASEVDYPFLRLRCTHVSPQGPSKVPSSHLLANHSKQTETERTIRATLRPEGARDDLVVVGMGFIDWRKGVDLFLAAATAILARSPLTPVRFIWVGEGYNSPIAMEVSSYISEQIMRSGLGDRFVLMDAVDDVESIYKEADILFLSSRLDPLPNVTIDATLRGIPVVCFAEASGMAEILASSDETRELVLPHLDVGAAAALIASLATDREKLSRLGDAVREVARARFDMDSYVSTLDELGRRAGEFALRRQADAELILSSGALDLPLYLGERAPFADLAATVREYSAVASKYDYGRAPEVHQAFTRRPLAGFHPVSYALQNSNYKTQKGEDPLAHYLRTGRPKGPWAHRVIRVESATDVVKLRPAPGCPALRFFLHGHFYHTDYIDELLCALAANEQQCGLILTTDSVEKAKRIRSTLTRTGAEADIRVVPNRGRDIGPFLMVLKEMMGRCDLLGHVHAKRSLHVDKSVADRWRIFLWQHLIGGEVPMVDIIKQAFTEDPALGLVFPEDPLLVGWDKNFKIAQELASRMELRTPLPKSIEFPVGTMFWARTEALAPLLRLDLTSDDYPHEPLPVDGTMLHALERLLGLVAEEAGYQFATTYLPRFVR